MKTLESVKSEIADLQKESVQALKDKLPARFYNKIEKKVKLLYQCQLYLETNPTQEFIEKQKADVSKKIKVINEGFTEWLKNNAKEADGCKNPKSKYQTYMGLKNIKAQYMTLNYLLSK